MFGLFVCLFVMFGFMLYLLWFYDPVEVFFDDVEIDLLIRSNEIFIDRDLLPNNQQTHVTSKREI